MMTVYILVLTRFAPASSCRRSTTVVCSNAIDAIAGEDRRTLWHMMATRRSTNAGNMAAGGGLGPIRDRVNEGSVGYTAGQRVRR